MLASVAATPFCQISPEVSMRILACFLMVLATQAAAGSSQPLVEAFLPPVFGATSTHAFYLAEGVVNDIYSEIGIRVVWKEARSAPAGCAKQPGHMQVVVEMQWQHSAIRSDTAMAVSYPGSTQGPCVTLLMNRLKPEIERNPLRTGFLLGHVLAHEIGHVLQGVARHSETGVMKSAWSLHETSHMWANARLQFTAYDAKLILDALRFPVP